MSLSPSAIATLVIIVLAGPLCWGFYFLYRKFWGKSGQPDSPQEDEGDRESVSSSDYLMSLVGYAIGIGNIWRFPYVISQNGGGAAVVAYLVCAVFVAVPLFLFELIIGQHTRLSTVRCYETIRPRWKSLGYAQALMVVLALSYYQLLLSYSCIYIVNSCQDPLPWSEEAYKSKELQGSVTAAEAFWEEEVLNQYTDADGLHGKPVGEVQWHLATALLAVWIMCFLAIAFGKKILARVTSVTVISPIILLLVLLVRAVLLDGARDGIEFYIGKIEWSELANISVWATCCSQILFSLSPGFGTAITMSSFTKKKEDVWRACMIVAVSNSLFSIVGGFATFSIVGHLAWRTDRTVEEVATRSGTGLAFITMAEAMTYFGDWANVMAVLFFVMLLSLGLDSSFAWLETVVSYVGDFFLERKWKVKRAYIVAGCSVAMFLLGLPFCTRMGIELLDVVDHFAATIFLLFCCFLESVMLSLDFGWERLRKAIKSTTAGNKGTLEGRDLNPYFWRCCLYLTVPMATVFLCGYLVADDLAEPYGDYPQELLAVGWTCLGLLLAITPLTMWKATTKGTLAPLIDLEPPATPAADVPYTTSPATGNSTMQPELVYPSAMPAIINANPQPVMYPAVPGPAGTAAAPAMC